MRAFVRGAVGLRLCLVVGCVAAGWVSLAGDAVGASPAPGWVVDQLAVPARFAQSDTGGCNSNTTLDPGFPACDSYQTTVDEAGGAATNGSPVVIEDILPAGLSLGRIELRWSGELVDLGPADCRSEPAGGLTRVRCEVAKTVLPDQTLKLRLYVTVNAGVTGLLTNIVSVSGAGAPATTSQASNQVGGGPPAFGMGAFDLRVTGFDGLAYRQAGGHPYEVKVNGGLNTALRPAPDSGLVEPTSVQDLKDIVVDLPAGLAGSVVAAPRCTLAQLDAPEGAGCPRVSEVGRLVTNPNGIVSVNAPVFNLVPERGVAGELGFRDTVGGTHVLYARVVPSPEGYVLQTTSSDIAQINLTAFEAVFYGDPAAKQEELTSREGKVIGPLTQAPLFTMPSQCAGRALIARVFVDSWQHPGRFHADGTIDTSDPNWVGSRARVPSVKGCAQLAFSPELEVKPTSLAADSPTGLELGLRMPQPERMDTLSTPGLRNATVVFPGGLGVDPSAARGLEGCSEAQIGWEGPGREDFDLAPPACPDASKLGSLLVESPLVEGQLHGEVFLAQQDENPFGSVFATYLAVNDARTGVVLKLAGELRSDPETGQLTAVFPESPQLPFSSLRVSLFPGPRGALATPESCGSFTTASDLEPWSAPDSGPDATPFSGFAISEGCQSGFAPAFTAGVTKVQAGGYTPVVISLSRGDSDHELAGLSSTFPPGLLAKLTGVPLCTPNPAALEVCPEASRIGSVTSFAGPGPDPAQVSGKVYLTGPYEGAPYGEAVVVPAQVGPFHLGDVVVRGGIYINPSTAQATVVSDPFPTNVTTIGLNGVKASVPIRLRRVDITLDRPEFAFNPTSCEPKQFAGALSSVDGERVSASTLFQVTDCASLKFAPRFTVATSAKTSRAKGASLRVKLSYPNTPQGTEANIAKVKVDLPRQLPSRLATLQQACPLAQFQANPAGCPAASIVGTARVTTPILPQPLGGPAYFVSHGGEAFPTLTIVLQGNGITLQLVGNTLIRKGITSSTFSSIPDAPVTTFELILSQGKHSALAAIGNLCRTRLTMPTSFQAQNGATLHQATRIAIAGCPKHHKH